MESYYARIFPIQCECIFIQAVSCGLASHHDIDDSVSNCGVEKSADNYFPPALHPHTLDYFLIRFLVSTLMGNISVILSLKSELRRNEERSHHPRIQ